MSQARVVVDHTHCGRHVTGLERITLELFSREALAPLDVEIATSRGVLDMALKQTLALPAALAADRRAILICPGFPPSIPAGLFGGRCLPYIHDLFLITRPADLNRRAKLYMAPAFRAAVKRLPRFLDWIKERSLLFNGAVTATMLRKDAYVVPLKVQNKPIGFVYIEPTHDLDASDRALISMMAQQCSNALENLRLHVDLTRSYDHMIDMLARIAEFKDSATGSHINRIDRYTRLVAIEMGLSEEEAAHVGRASRLHDVGKIGIPDAILRKPGRLDEAEYAIVRTHTGIGKSILDNDAYLATACDIATHHHERWDGTGYPEGRPSREFALATRIVSVIDVFDALISRRPYKEPWSVQDAAAEVERGAGTQFDPAVVAAVMKLLRSGIFDPIIDAARQQNSSPESFLPAGD